MNYSWHRIQCQSSCFALSNWTGRRLSCKSGIVTNWPQRKDSKSCQKSPAFEGNKMLHITFPLTEKKQTQYKKHFVNQKALYKCKALLLFLLSHCRHGHCMRNASRVHRMHRSISKNLTSQLKELEKEKQMNSKVCKMKERKIRVKIHETETNKTTEKINET